jgi:taurine dioxygenase
VIVFKSQNISPEIFRSFGEIFGEVEIHHVTAMRHPKVQELVVLSNQNEIGRNPIMKYFGDGWHSDSSYKAIPANATMLYGTEIPNEGGDTLFSDVEAAFHDLPDSEKSYLRTLRLRHQYRWSPDREDPWARWKFVGDNERQATPEFIHPLVRKNPDTGTETLHIAPRIIGSVIGIEGMSFEESDPLLDKLMAHVTQDRYQYRHKWSKHDVIVWDNRRLLHSATTKDMVQTKVRRLLRITTKGTPVVAANPIAGLTVTIVGSEHR